MFASMRGARRAKKPKVRPHRKKLSPFVARSRIAKRRPPRFLDRYIIISRFEHVATSPPGIDDGRSAREALLHPITFSINLETIRLRSIGQVIPLLKKSSSAPA